MLFLFLDGEVFLRRKFSCLYENAVLRGGEMGMKISESQRLTPEKRAPGMHTPGRQNRIRKTVSLGKEQEFY